MNCFIIIRGPAAVGKSTVAKRLAERIDGEFITFDKVMADNHLDKIEGDGISTGNFVKANSIVLPTALEALRSGRSVVFDGCFYRMGQIEDLLKKLPFKHYIFTLYASLEECLKRNDKRQNPIKQKEIEQVYKLVKSLKVGINIDTTGKGINEVIVKIMKICSKDSS
ncbi:ATP-binding protein [Candidatus Woesearchaeota archaeon]|nr:ATP-binding protein [Candidatus Woesearchaeota archaeon]